MSCQGWRKSMKLTLPTGCHHNPNPSLNTKGGLIPPFSDTFDTKYRAENFTDTDSDTDTNAYRHMVAIISHLLLYKYIDKAFK